jgi:hypothetical protein
MLIFFSGLYERALYIIFVEENRRRDAINNDQSRDALQQGRKDGKMK